MAKLPNFLVIIRSEKLSGKGQGRGVGVRKKERFVLGKRTFRSQKSKHFVLRIIQTGDFTYIVFLALYGVDSVLTICHRILLHENLGKAHRKHAYQLMANELRIPHVVVSSFYMMLQLLVSFGLILLPMNHWLYLVMILVVLCGSYLLFMKRYYHLHESYLRSLNN